MGGRYGSPWVSTVFEQPANYIEYPRSSQLILPEKPSSDGTYTLQLSVSSGSPTLTWVAVS